MRYESTRLKQMLAAEYVLGTLVGGARRRFQRLLGGDRWLRGEVRYWQQRFDELGGFEPMPPREVVWAEIERRIRQAQDTVVPLHAHRRRPIWNYAAGLAAAASLALAALLLRQTAPEAPSAPPPLAQATAKIPALVATLSPPDEAASWSLRVLPDRQVLQLRASARATLAAQSDYQLWWLKDDGGVASLGLLPREGVRNIALPPALNIKAGGKVAVSLEPAGGSPARTAPSGPVLLAAPLEVPA